MSEAESADTGDEVANSESNEQTDEYRVTRNSHTRIEDGERVTYEPGETFVPTERELSTFGRKLEAVNSAPTETRDEALDETQPTKELRGAADTTEPAPASAADAEGASEAADSPTEADDSGPSPAEFLDRSVETIQNAINAGHGDDQLLEIYEEEHAGDERKTAISAITDRLDEKGIEIPDLDGDGDGE